jgi:predicted outer membrane repeat protein
MTRLGMISLALLVGATAGCGSDPEKPPGEGGATGSGGSGGGEPIATCSEEDTFDEGTCPANYPEGQCAVFVDGEAIHGGDGWSWGAPKATVHAGVDLAHCGALQSSACERWEVWVKQGTYHQYAACRHDTVRLRGGVDLYGGFAGTEQFLEERDPAAHETILDGRDAAEDALYVLHVVHGADDARLDGFTVQYGRADHESEEAHQRGGGMSNVGVSPLVHHVTFRHNFAVDGGGGVNNEAASATFVDCLFEQNKSATFGGGIRSRESGLTTIVGTTFRDNHATSRGGGGLFVWGGEADVQEATFEANGAGDIGGGFWLNGATASVRATHVTGNHAARVGGGFVVFGGSAAIAEVTVTQNSADEYGGGLWVGGGGEMTMTNSIVFGNLAILGGAMDLGGAQGVSLNHCTIAGNGALSGGALYGIDEVLAVTNSIFWNPDAPTEMADHGDATMQFSFSNVRDGMAGERNLSEDPLLVDLMAGDLHLQPSSPCINSADPATAPETDIDGTPRDALPDMGAYEYVP